MEKTLPKNISLLQQAIRTAARAARRKAFRKGLPVAVSKNGKVVNIYKDKTEVTIDQTVSENGKNQD